MEHKTPQNAILDALSQEDDSVLMLAYLYAKNFHLYGLDITKAMETAKEQAEAMSSAYNRGYIDACEKLSTVRGQNVNNLGGYC